MFYSLRIFVSLRSRKVRPPSRFFPLLWFFLTMVCFFPFQDSTLVPPDFFSPFPPAIELKIPLFSRTAAPPPPSRSLLCPFCYFEVGTSPPSPPPPLRGNFLYYITPWSRFQPPILTNPASIHDPFPFSNIDTLRTI